MDCQSCGMPMATDADHGGGKSDNLYCKYCTDPAGNLKPKDQVREGMINFQMSQSLGKTRDEVAAEVDAHMSQMPVWLAGIGQAPVGLNQTPPPAEPVVPTPPPSPQMPSTAPTPSEPPLVPPVEPSAPPTVLPEPEDQV